MSKFYRSFWLNLLPSLVTLGWVIGLIFYLLFLRPYSGILTVTKTGEVLQIYGDETVETQLRVGDWIQKIGNREYPGSPTGSFFTPHPFSGYQTGDSVPVTVERNGQTLLVTHTFFGPNWEEFLLRLGGQWLIPLFFWLAGMMTLLFIRPRSQVSFLMAQFFFLTAIWVMAGVVSAGLVVWAAMAMRVAIWLTIPVYWHFLWLFPTPLGPLKRSVVLPVYGFGLLMSILQAFNLFPASLYLLGFLLALTGSLLLIIMHFVLHPAERRALAGLLVAVMIIFLPVIGASLVSSVSSLTSLGSMAVSGFSALPGYFFITLFHRQMEGQSRQINTILRVYVAAILVETVVAFLPFLIIEMGVNLDFSVSVFFATFFTLFTMLVGFSPFLILPALARAEVQLPLGGERPLVIRANRLAADVFFFLLLFFVALVMFFAIDQFITPVWQGLAAAAVGLGLAFFTARVRETFQVWFQEKLLGMPLHPERLVKQFSERILNSLEENGLRSLLLNELLPSLLVRQSAMLRFLPGGGTVSFLALRVSQEQTPTPQQAARLSAGGLRLVQPEDLPAALAWVRLVVPLPAGKQTGGVWLFGARDPDDAYFSDDLETIEVLTGQTALALTHIDQANNLRALYQTDVDQRDAERHDFARELHDAVLNPLAAVMNTEEPLSPQIDHELQEITQHVRRVVKGLRPELLNYGLFLGLQTLIDDLQDSLPANGPQLSLDMPESQARLDSKVELNLFRIVQQACHNAARHASASTICVSGSIEETQVFLKVEDDGHGFTIEGALDLPGLLAGQHYGLAGMYERAGVIGASLRITSTPGQGTQVEINWKKQ